MKLRNRHHHAEETGRGQQHLQGYHVAREHIQPELIAREFANQHSGHRNTGGEGAIEQQQTKQEHYHRGQCVAEKVTVDTVHATLT